MKARAFRIDPRDMRLDVLERAMIRDALAAYAVRRKAQAKTYAVNRYIEAAEDDAARAEDLMIRFTETLR